MNDPGRPAAPNDGQGDHSPQRAQNVTHGKNVGVSIGATDNVKPTRPLDPAARFDQQFQEIDQAIADAGDITTREKIIVALKHVHDPEIPVNVYDLGLIYKVDVDNSNNVHIEMTLTSAACPAAHEIPVDVRKAASRVPEVGDVDVDLVFDPPWSQEHMSDVAKIQLGLM